jgi:hypothetical protein
MEDCSPGTRDAASNTTRYLNWQACPYLFIGRPQAAWQSVHRTVRAEDFLIAARYNHVHILWFLIEFESREFLCTHLDMKQRVGSVKFRGVKFGSILPAHMQATVIEIGRCFLADV